jgi:hypothetical protein
MHDYFFLSTKITENQVKDIIKTAGYDPTGYAYQALVGRDGYLARGADPMAISRLEKAAKDLGIKVEISSPSRLVADQSLVASNGHGHAGNGHRTVQATSTVYTLDFINDTPDTWVFSVYQTLPESPGLKSLSWKQTTIPRGGESGVQWTVDYLVSILNYRQIGGKGVYRASQKLGTSLGQAWDAVFDAGTQQLVEAGNAPTKGQVIINNKSGQLADLGIGMDGDVALVQAGVYAGAGANFEVEPTYWVAMYKDIVKGEVISGAQVAGPIKVKFLNGATSITYRAWLEGPVLRFAPADGSSEGVRAPLDQVAMRVEQIQRRELAALQL